MQYVKTVLLAFISLIFVISLIVYPKEALEASMQGLSVWSHIVFPSLLPFFVVSQLMIGFGVVQFISVLLEPIMRPLFRVPGAGGFAWVLGMVSGYPAGAKITVQLREKGIVNQIEAERLIAFTNASSPLFIFGAIAIGFFHNASVGILIALSHYISIALVGICMRFYGKNEMKKDKKMKHNSNLLVKAFKQMHHTRINETRPFGTILSEAVLSSIRTLIMIGGFITLFSVLTKMLQLFQFNYLFALLIKPFFALLSIPIEMTIPFITGLFEITIGIKSITSYDNISLLIQLILVSFLLGLNGFSIQAQVASVISNTDIRFFPYIIGRLLHAIFATMLTIILFKPIYLNENLLISTFYTYETNERMLNFFMYFNNIGPYITLVSLFIAIVIILKRFQQIER